MNTVSARGAGEPPTRAVAGSWPRAGAAWTDKSTPVLVPRRTLIGTKMVHYLNIVNCNRSLRTARGSGIVITEVPHCQDDDGSPIDWYPSNRFAITHWM